MKVINKWTNAYCKCKNFSSQKSWEISRYQHWNYDINYEYWDYQYNTHTIHVFGIFTYMKTIKNNHSWIRKIPPRPMDMVWESADLNYHWILETHSVTAPVDASEIRPQKKPTVMIWNPCKSWEKGTRTSTGELIPWFLVAINSSLYCNYYEEGSSNMLYSKNCLGGGNSNICLFTPLEKMNPFWLYNIFQRGWNSTTKQLLCLIDSSFGHHNFYKLKPLSASRYVWHESCQ